MYPFAPWLASDGTNLIASAQGELRALDENNLPSTTVLQAYDAEGQPMPTVDSGPTALIQRFQLEEGMAWWVSGEHQVLVVSWVFLFETVLAAKADSVAAADAAEASRLLAEAAESQLPGGGSLGQALLKLSAADRDVGWGTVAAGEGGAAGPHSHIVDDLRRSFGGSGLSSVIIGLLNALDMQGARAAIGAGTGNGTSNLQIGNGPNDAASATHTHPSYQTQAQVQAAIDTAISTAGTAPAGTIVGRRYTSGAYPVRGTLPTGVMVAWIGPVFPPVGGSYFVEGTDVYWATP